MVVFGITRRRIRCWASLRLVALCFASHPVIPYDDGRNRFNRGIRS